ncbi:hypothetical protein DNTS_001835, partial [Danionella cerebrum]
MRELEEKCPHKPDHQKRRRKGCVKVADWRQRQGGLQKCEGTCWRAKWGHWEIKEEFRKRPGVHLRQDKKAVDEEPSNQENGNQ